MNSHTTKEEEMLRRGDLKFKSKMLEVMITKFAPKDVVFGVPELAFELRVPPADKARRAALSIALRSLTCDFCLEVVKTVENTKSIRYRVINVKGLVESREYLSSPSTTSPTTWVGPGNPFVAASGTVGFPKRIELHLVAIVAKLDAMDAKIDRLVKGWEVLSDTYYLYNR